MLEAEPSMQLVALAVHRQEVAETHRRTERNRRRFTTIR